MPPLQKKRAYKKDLSYKDGHVKMTSTDKAYGSLCFWAMGLLGVTVLSWFTVSLHDEKTWHCTALTVCCAAALSVFIIQD